MLRDPRAGARPGGFRSFRKVFPVRPAPALSVPSAGRSEAGNAAEPLRRAGNGAGGGGAAAASSGRGLGQVRPRAERVPTNACGGKWRDAPGGTIPCARRISAGGWAEGLPWVGMAAAPWEGTAGPRRRAGSEAGSGAARPPTRRGSLHVPFLFLGPG